MILLLIVPLRHVILDTNGLVSALLIAALALVAFWLGYIFDSKSGWCSGICPVHQVEKLYGSRVLLSPPNAHCSVCRQCVTHCPDSTPGVDPFLEKKSRLQFLSGYLMVGGFPGFIWGWFQVPDYYGLEGWSHLGTAYGWPFLGLVTSLSLYWILVRMLPKKLQRTLISIFAASAVILYYWFRLPALIGFGMFPGDGMLVDLSMVLPSWTPYLLGIITTLLFSYLIIIRSSKRVWVIRPPYNQPKFKRVTY